MKKRILSIAFLLGLPFVITGCPKRDQPPKSSYDPELVEVAQELSKTDQVEDDTVQNTREKTKGECTSTLNNCKEGFICWDSMFCRQDNPDQCSAQGDKLCHKKCNDDSDCPESMPRCIEKPIFRHSDRGPLEKFCVR